MADSPLLRLVRLLGGAMLMQGRVPHRVLGQLLMTNATSVEVVGANLIITAAASQPNEVAQVAIRTIVPMLAVNQMARREARRIARVERAAHEALERLDREREQLDQQLLALRLAQARLARARRRRRGP